MSDKLINKKVIDEEEDEEDKSTTSRSSNDDISIDDDQSDQPEEDDEMDEEKIFKDNEKVNELYNEDDEDDDDDDDEEINVSQENTFDRSIKSNIITQFHPELKSHSYEEILSLSTIIRDDAGNIIDPLHKTRSDMTKYEYSRILGERAKQLSIGADPLVKLNDYIVDEYSIATIELKAKKIPFILERILPDGTAEYWKLEDLEILI